MSPDFHSWWNMLMKVFSFFYCLDTVVLASIVSALSAGVTLFESLVCDSVSESIVVI